MKLKSESEDKISINENYVRCFVAHNGDDAKKFAIKVVTKLRDNGIRSVLGSPSRSYAYMRACAYFYRQLIRK